MASALRDGVAGIDLTMRITLGVLALASGVYTYLGVRDLLDGSALITFFAALIYSTAVSVAIYAFWSFLMRFLPHVRDVGSRLWLGAAMVLGSLMIVAMSSWLNAAALAGSAAIEQHLAVTLQAYTRDLDAAHNRALAAQSLLPDIQLASTRFARLADAERSGALTGTGGSGDRGAASEPDGGPARRPRTPGDGERRTLEAALCGRQRANRQDARVRLRAGRHQGPERRLRRGGFETRRHCGLARTDIHGACRQTRGR
jgi:hypothetical protein